MTELTDRMRTCAAFMRSQYADYSGIGAVLTDAAALLEEAATELEKPPAEPVPLVPWKPIEEKPKGENPPLQEGDLRPSTFTDPGPPAARPRLSTRVCPSCGSRGHKTVHVKANRLECPACAFQWPYVQDGKWV